MNDNNDLGKLIDAHLANADAHLEKMKADRLAGGPDPAMARRFNYYTSLGHWWPKILHTDVPKPRTRLVEIPYKDWYEAAWQLEEGTSHERIIEILNPHLAKCQEFLFAQFPQKAFMRSFFHSAKHEIDGPAITTGDELQARALTLLHETLLKDIPFEGLAIREFLHLEHKFTAFQGLPIARERRVLVTPSPGKFQEPYQGTLFQQEGISVRVFPYWPKKAIVSWKDPLPEGWEAQLDELNRDDARDTDILARNALVLYRELAADHPNWTFDFARTVGGTWYFIDAAVAEASWLPTWEDFR